jgi:hypothetical protein
MGIEYKLRFDLPKNYDPSGLFRKLPSPVHRPSMQEIYNYSIESDGFYFVDHLVDQPVAAMAFKRFVDEALGLRVRVELLEP